MLKYSRPFLGRVVEEGPSRRMGATHDRPYSVSLHQSNLRHVRSLSSDTRS